MVRRKSMDNAKKRSSEAEVRRNAMMEERLKILKAQIGAQANEVNDLTREYHFIGNQNSEYARLGYVNSEYARLGYVEFFARLRAKQEAEKRLADLREELKKLETKFESSSYGWKIRQLGSPSVVATNSRKFKDVLDQVFVCQRPAENCGFPLTLKHAAFANLSGNIKSGDYGDEDCKFVLEICAIASEIHVLEKTYREQLTRLLTDYLGNAIRVEQCTENDSDVDVTILSSSCSRQIALIEIKAEPGSGGDPFYQSLMYYSMIVLEDDRNFFPFPMLIIELVGPLIRFGCASFNSKVIWEPATTFLHLFHLDNSKYLEQLARTFHAVKVCLSDLDAYYQQRSNKIDTPVDRPDNLDIPYSLLEKYSTKNITKLGKTGDVDVNFFYLVKKDGEGTRLVKFCQQYNSLVHETWAAENLAPECFCSENLPGRWVVVEMKFLDNSEGWFTLESWNPNRDRDRFPAREKSFELSLAEWTVLEEKVFSALEKAHNLQVPFPGRDEKRSVHGDVRLCNVMYNRSSDLVYFIDFDWAEPHGIGRYPGFLSQSVNWPEGVGSHRLMEQQHDLELLKMEFTLASKTKDTRRLPRLSQEKAP